MGEGENHAVASWPEIERTSRLPGLSRHDLALPTTLKEKKDFLLGVCRKAIKQR